MSSFIGFINGDKELSEKVASIGAHLSPVIQSSFCTVYSETDSNRLFHGPEVDTTSGWVVSGIGIQAYPRTEILSKSEWNRLFSSQSEAFNNLNGHFVGVKVESDIISIFTDQVGMRSLFLLQLDNTFIFSTRIDWLIPFSKCEMDWEDFGEHWLSINSFSDTIFLRDIKRIHSGAICTLSHHGLHHQAKNWTPSPTDIDLESYLMDISTAVYRQNEQISLGLSGGLDSRLLLAILAGNPNLEFDLYTFSGVQHPDEEVAKVLGEQINVSHQLLNYIWLDFNIEDLATQSTRSLLNSSIPEVLSNTLYIKLGEANNYSLDGGIGEIGRRRYLRSIQLRAKKAVIEKNAPLLAPYFLSPKADIFIEDVNQQMAIGFNQSLVNKIELMPELTPISVGNWLDLFSIQTRLLNIAGFNQELVDSSHFHIMPFVQPDFLNAVLSMPVIDRLNAKWYRRLIKKHLPFSTKVPLVKGDDVYPFWLKDISSQLWLKLRKQFIKPYQNPLLINVLQSNESDIRDILSPSIVNRTDCYDSKKIDDLVCSFYDRNEFHVATSLNWTLTFELFRKKLANEHI